MWIPVHASLCPFDCLEGLCRYERRVHDLLNIWWLKGPYFQDATGRKNSVCRHCGLVIGELSVLWGRLFIHHCCGQQSFNYLVSVDRSSFGKTSLLPRGRGHHFQEATSVTEGSWPSHIYLYIYIYIDIGYIEGTEHGIAIFIRKTLG